MMPPCVKVIGSPVTALRFHEQLELIAHWATRRESRYVCVANVHMLMEAHRSPDFQEILRGADLVTPDGTPLVWMMRWLGAPRQDRVAGMDLLPQLCAYAETQGLAVYFLGSTEEVIGRIHERLRREFPRLKVAGLESPPFRPLSSQEEADLLERIKASHAQLLFVSLGCPKQERWMARFRGEIPAVMLGLGAAFPVFAGRMRMAPEWMRRSGLEWLYRLAQEPRRLWRRYWETNMPFTWLALRQLLSERFSSAPADQGSHA